MSMQIHRHVGATGESMAHMERYLERADRMKTDPEKEKRESAHYCRWCYYTSFVGVDWTTPCMVCDEEVFGRNKVCETCAVEHRLCRKCGGDLDMRARRRKW
jgi:hypothetical protein